MTYTERHLDNFVHSFLQTLLWSTSDNMEGNLDDKYDIEDFGAGAFVWIRKDCSEFLKLCETEGYTFTTYLNWYGNEQWSQLEQAAHDYCLTRNGEGTGFWDREAETYPDMDLDRLSELARSRGGVTAYLEDDGRIYVSGMEN